MSAKLKKVYSFVTEADVDYGLPAPPNGCQGEHSINNHYSNALIFLSRLISNENNRTSNFFPCSCWPDCSQKKHPKIYIKIQKLKDIKMGFFFYNWFNGLRQRLILDIAKNLWWSTFVKIVNPLSANPTKWSNTLNKQFVGNLPTNFLSVFDHFVGLALKIVNEWSC